jgi:hypothetical protein
VPIAGAFDAVAGECSGDVEIGMDQRRGHNRPTVDEPLAAQGASHPYAADLEAERRGWYELADLVRSLTPAECLEPGYYGDTGWTVRDVVAHLGTWLAEAEVQFERLAAGTYEGHDIDIDALNARFLEAMADQPWDVAWVQANAGRTMMLGTWHELREPTDEAAWWIRKSGAEHFAEHLEPLRTWVAELIGRRGAATPSTPIRE